MGKKVAIIDAELIGKKKHRFPNLVSMKISGYCKDKGYDVELITEYNEKLYDYDHVFLSKVFTDTEIPGWVLSLNNIRYGGTGFYYDKAKPLPERIEHHMPDYHLYDDWVHEKIYNGEKEKNFEYYLKYSIGFMTRGCIRQCSFCVNKNYKKCERKASVYEFLDQSRPYICLLDDNVLACAEWREIFKELYNTGKRFQFKQGMDERLLTGEKCDIIFNKSKWISDYIFAFDNIADKDVIVKKLKLIRQYTDAIPKFYVLCAYDRVGKYDEKFWIKDMNDLLERIKILFQFKCLPYIMRYEKYKESTLKDMYIELCRWCNQPGICKKMSFEEFCNHDANVWGKTYETYSEFRNKYPKIAEKYFKMKWGEV